MGKAPKVKLKINLSEMFGEEMPDNEALRLAVGQTIIDRIKERTQSGVDKRNQPFKKYSKRYINSDEFEAFGKSSGDVNLTLSGDMLELMEILRSSKNVLEIGWEDETQNAKAYNHTVGDTVPRRDFFGISKTELKEIASEFSDEVKSFRELNETQNREEFVGRALNLIRTIRGRSGEGTGS